MPKGRKLAFIFPGQGAQRVGMGSGLLDSNPEIFERYFGAAEDASGLALRKYALEGPAEVLIRTDVAQPALFACSLALTDVARSLGLAPDFVAGHSLGECTAAVAAGALGVEDGMRFVVRRGQLMQDAQSSRPGAMAAVRDVEVSQLEKICRAASTAGSSVRIANLNSPRQIVVSGDDDAVARLLELVPNEDRGRAIRLRVGAAFHSELMKPVQAELAETIAAATFRDPNVSLVANWSGRVVSDGEGVRDALLRQIARPVRWMDCVRSLLDAGCRRLIELGPASVLSSISREIDPDVEAVGAKDPAELIATMAAAGSAA